MPSERILRQVETAFAEAVEAGEYAAAEGWVAVAAWIRSRSARPVPAGR